MACAAPRRIACVFAICVGDSMQKFFISSVASALLASPVHGQPAPADLHALFTHQSVNKATKIGTS
jgi:hypothetical protein